MEPQTPANFADFIRQAFEERRARSQFKYSFRAFASELKMDASTLHHIMTGKRNAGPIRKRAILEKLYSSKEEIEVLMKWFA